MKINDLFETQQDEGIGSALGKVAGGIGKAVGGAVGGARAIGSAAKAGYKAGSAGAQKSILGQTFPDVNLAGGNAPAGQQGNQTQGATTTGQQQTAPAQGNTPQANAQQQAPGEAPTQAPAQDKVEPTMEPAQAPAQGQPAAAEAPKSTAMKGDQIAGELKGVWDKASADQGSMTGSPQVQQQIIAMAKAAGLAGRKIEGKQFYSKFLGKDI